MSDESDIWRQLRARGYERKENDRTKVEVQPISLDAGTLYQVRFYFPDSGLQNISAFYPQVLAKIGQLPLRSTLSQ